MPAYDPVKKINKTRKRKETIKDTKKKSVVAKKPKPNKKKQLSRQKIIWKLDSITSKIVRLSSIDKNWDITCYTCSKKIPRKDAHCAHFIERGCMRYRFDFSNLRACCAGCNMYHQQNHIRVYTLKLIKEYWFDKVEEMQNNKLKIYKIGINELRDLLYERKEILDQMLGK